MPENHVDTAFWLVWLSRLGAAVLAGALLGIEREIAGKAAGLRTIVLITLGAALFMIASELVGLTASTSETVRQVADPGRIAAQVVTGVGFIGAGAIIVARGHHVYGLTTAALIWAAAGIGLVIGLGHVLFGLLVAAGILLLLVGFEWLERHVISRFVREDAKTPRREPGAEGGTDDDGAET